MKIPLTQGLVTKVDRNFGRYPNPHASDVLNYSWSATPSVHGFYARRSVRLRTGNFKTIYLHRVLMGAPKSLQVDHVDGDKLNNVAANLRLVNRTEQRRAFRNRLARCASRFRGVSWCKTKRKWVAKIKYRGRTHNLGRFCFETNAALAYSRAAKKFFGKFAQINRGLW